MEKSYLKRIRVPDKPGVYFFLGAKKKILYIGKATSLKQRIRSYFTDNIQEKRSTLIEKMIQEAKSIEFTETDSVLEALILETNLIRSHKPFYNTRSKDDKSFNHLIITNETYPRVLVVRGKDVTEKYTDNEIKYHFGPFPSGALFKDALKIVRKLFQYYDTDRPVGTEKNRLGKGKIDFNKQIGLFPKQIDKQEYNRTIKHITLFFQGKKKELLQELEREMHTYASKELFEEANRVKKQIFALKHIQDISLIKSDLKAYRDDRNLRIEAYDIAHLQGDNMVGVMTVVESGQTLSSEYRKFKINDICKANDVAALKQVLERRLQHTEWPMPQIVVVDGSTAQKNAAEKVLKDHHLVIPVVGVVKNEKHKPVRLIGQSKLLQMHKDEILLANSESHRFAIAYHRQKQRKQHLL